MPITSFVLYIVVSSFTPGPNNIMAMTLAQQSTFKRTLSFCLGVGVGFLLIMLVSSFFNLTLASYLPMIELPLKYLGALYLLYLSFKIIQSTSTDIENEGVSRYFRTGIIMQFLNPKGILYGITVVSLFILPYYKEPMTFVLFAVLLGGVGFVSASTWALCGTLFQTVLSKYQRSFNILMALLLIYCAVTLFMPV